ncbi:hypothetical protein FMGBMHLM_4352 [Methylobacterium aerolatum]|nr:hypothetical protein FMGBMHLM_4352 [Methylobacterium aerolatum]
MRGAATLSHQGEALPEIEPGCLALPSHRLVDQVRQRDDAEHPSPLVCHGDHRHPVMAQQVQGLAQRRVGGDGLNAAREERAAGRLAGPAQGGMDLRLPEDRLKVAPVDIEHLVELGQRRVDIGGSEPRPHGGVRRGGLGGGVRVAPSRQIVEHEGAAEQQRRVQPHGPGDEGIAEVADTRAAQDRRERHGAARRVQATEQHHQRDGHRNGHGPGNHRIPDLCGGRHSDEGGDAIPAEDRPGLGERAGRHGEEQHGRGPHGRDQQRPRRGGAYRAPHRQARAEQAEQGAAGRAEPLLNAGLRHSGDEEREQPVRHRVWSRRGNARRRPQPGRWTARRPEWGSGGGSV